MTFTEVFGGTTIYPSGVSYRAVALSANQTLAWPVETATNANIVAQIMDVTPSIASLSILMPPANEASVGETTLFFNAGSFAFTVRDNGGNTIVSIAPGLSYQVYLIGNNTVNGTWRSTQYAAGTSSATAGSLVGAGIKAINTTLNQSMTVTSLNSNYTIGDADRSEAFLWSGGAGTLTLPSAVTVGNDWFCHVRNGGTGAISLATTGGQLINGASSLAFNPGDSAIVICDGSGFFTIGFGQSASFAFDYVSIDLTSQTSPYTLAGANLNRIAYSFGGTLTANMTIHIPATFQQYWLANETLGGFAITVKVAGQTGVIIGNGVRAICYCNGTDLVDADTSSFSFPVSIAQGGTGAVNESGARINLGGTSTGIAVFTAANAASARSSLLAAASGANSDITSLTGLTTPLSVSQGGTGASTLAANGVLVGNGTSAAQVTAVGSTGQVLIGNTGAAPSWAALSGSAVTSFSAGTTGLTPSTGTQGAVTLAGTLSVANGGTGAINAGNARTNLGATIVGGNLFTLANPSAITFPRFNADNSVSTLDAATFRTAIGATTVGGNMFTLANPSAVTFPRFNADNTVSALDAATFRSAIGAGTGAGSVTSVGMTVPAFLSVSPASITSSGTFAVTLSGTALPIANGGTGSTATAYCSLTTNVTGTLPIANGGTGATTAPLALSALGAYPATNPSGYTSNTGTVTSVTGSGGTTGLTLSGTVTTSGSLTLGGTLVVANGGTGAADAGNARTNLGAAASGAVTTSGITMSTARILGRTTASTGAIEEITVGSGLSLSGGTLSSIAGGGSVTSVSGTGTVNGITLTGTVTSSGSLTLGGSLSGVSLTTQVSGTLPIANGGTNATDAAGARTNLGANAIGSSMFTLTNPSAVTFPRFNADNTVSALDAASFRSAIGAGTSSSNGTVTSVGLTLPSFLSVSTSTITTSGTFAVTLSGTALPTSNGGTGSTSTAYCSLTTNVTGTLPIANGGTGATTAALALSSLGAYPASNPSGYTSNTGTVTSVGGTGSANGLSLSGTVTTSGNITLSGSVTSVATTATIDGVTIGFRSIPRSTTSGTAAVGDVGRCIAVTAGITIPNATFAAGDAVSIYNDSASAVTITQGTSLTLRQAGTTNTGNRTLAARGMATIWFNSSSEAIISGAGVS